MTRHRRPHPNSRFVEPLEPRKLLTGLTGQYFDRVDFSDLKLTRTDATVNFSWGSAAPDPSMDPEGFSVRWTGQVQPAFSEKYTFYVTSDDGVRLWVDGRLLIDNWVRQSATEKSASIALTGGQLYDLRMDYEDVVQTATATLSWSSPSRAKQIIPSGKLFPSSSGLDATFFDNADFTGTSVQRVDPSVNFNWGTGSPDPAVTGTFSASWTGQVIPSTSAGYTFFATAESGAGLELRVDDQLLVDSTSIQDGGQIYLEAGKRYDIELDYAHNTGPSNMKLEWSSPFLTRQVVPTTSLIASKVDWAPTKLANYTNTIQNNDRPDPGVLFADGSYWMTHTTGGPSTGWPLYQSTDMVSGWTKVATLLDSTNKPSWMTGSFWAPEIHKINGEYVLTGTSQSTTYGHLVIVMATASEITGPYTVRSTPIVNDTVGCLDSHIFQDFDGKVYLIWKRQGPTNGVNGSIRLRELDTNDLTSFAPASTEVTLLNNDVGGWEKNLEEAPWMVRHGSYYYLFYSAAFIDTSYANGVARATSITGPYTRDPDNPILASNATWGGPGHGSMVQDVDGTVWFYYHARHQDNPDFGRVQMLDRVIWTASEWPSFAGSSPSTTQQIGPRVVAASGSGKYTLSGDTSGVVTDDTIRLVRNTTDASLLDVQLNGVTKMSVAFAEIENLTLNGVSGNDILVLDYSRGDVIPGSGITFNGNAGTDRVQIIAANASDTFHLSAGQITHGSGIITLATNETISLVSGTVNVDGDLGAMSLDAIGTNLLMHTSEHLSSLTLSGAAMAALDVGGSRMLRTSALSISGGARLDLADNDLIVDYSTTSPTTSIGAQITTARNHGSWDGAGITTSMSAAKSPSYLTTLAVADSSSALNITGIATATWQGESVDATTTLVRYTYTGDSNLDGVITSDDYFRIDSGFAAHANAYAAGDFDYNGKVDADDYFLIDSNYGDAQHQLASAPTLKLNGAVFNPSQITIQPIASRDDSADTDFIDGNYTGR